MTPPLPRGGRARPTTTHDIDDALTGEIEPNLWNGFGHLPMTRRTELAAQAVATAALLLALAVGGLVTRHRSGHQATDAPVAAQAGAMAAGLLWSVLLAPAVLAAAWFAARLALHLIAERHEARAWREQAADHEDAATGSEYGGL